MRTHFSPDLEFKRAAELEPRRQDVAGHWCWAKHRAPVRTTEETEVLLSTYTASPPAAPAPFPGRVFSLVARFSGSLTCFPGLGSTPARAPEESVLIQALSSTLSSSAALCSLACPLKPTDFHTRCSLCMAEITTASSRHMVW